MRFADTLYIAKTNIYLQVKVTECSSLYKGVHCM